MQNFVAEGVHVADPTQAQKPKQMVTMSTVMGK
jgi:hypothetical protein